MTDVRVAELWAARLALADASAAGSLRLLPEVEAAVEEGPPPSLWLRGPEMSDEISGALRRVPGIERFRVLADGLLAEPAARVPSARLPALAWAPVSRVLGVALPAHTSAGERPAAVRLRVAPSTAERPAAAVLTDVVAWEAWCALAPEVRLARLEFAACADGRVLVRGAPLPPIPGAVALWEEGAVFVPCGHATEPDVGGQVLRKVLGLSEKDLALLGTDGTYEVVPVAHFAKATRGAARLTRRALGPH